MSLTKFSLIPKPRTIACIGRNYAGHIKELSNERPKEPFYFLKPATSILNPGQGPILAPRGADLHYEIELAMIMGRTVDEIQPSEEALDAVKGYCVGIDMTARNWHQTARRKGLPWSLVKGFKTFLPVSHFIPKNKIPDPHNVRLHLEVNGELRQDDNTSLMLFGIPRILQHISGVFALEEDDLVLTGTPKGVGSVVPGDVITAGLSVDGIVLEEGRIEAKVEERAGGYSRL
ncbi:hypothetical protein B9Z19DRAFT_1099888 [Tuber borchii]|uniref:Fumarylacetoacetase-like C-terminal domain-containing protein n=1 Tax=Tuber borchii TaxID=42251 RepID=A0A2T7A0B4_TUBBO|nr:hypothetical protein B9Z19DRAFT_1099888 [Tuber borchii]